MASDFTHDGDLLKNSLAVTALDATPLLSAVQKSYSPTLFSHKIDNDEVTMEKTSRKVSPR